MVNRNAIRQDKIRELKHLILGGPEKLLENIIENGERIYFINGKPVGEKEWLHNWSKQQSANPAEEQYVD